MRKAFRHIWLLVAVLIPVAVSGQDLEKLDSVVVSASRNNSLVIPGPGVESHVRTDLLYHAPSLLGNADPLRFVRMLPGVVTGSELDAGIHVQGTEHQHTLISVEGVPIYGASHLLGLFSVFIPSHYGAMEYSSGSREANRLGGTVEMKLPQTCPERFSGSVSMGLISSEGTLSIPLGSSAAVFLSARKSYINGLYGSFLQLDDNVFSYGFGDANLTFLWKPTARDLIWVDAYAGMDNLGYGSYENGMDIDLDWNNAAGAVHWIRRGGAWQLKQTLYHTRFGLGMDIRHDFFDITMPSSIATTAYRADYRRGRLWAVAELACHRIHPQHVHAEGGSFHQVSPDQLQQGVELSLLGRYELVRTPVWALSASLKGQLWHDGAKLHPYLSPEVDGSVRLGPGQLSGTVGIARQFLFQTGLSSIALPYEFWLMAGEYGKPQSSLFGHLAYDYDIDGGAWRFSAEVFWRELSNQLEYKGSILDFVREPYALENALLKGDGRSFGASLFLRKQSGRLTGWAAYTIGRSLRRFDNPDYPDVYPSNHERRQEFNLMLSWTARKWQLSGSFVAADGTPFTAVKSLYVAQNQLLCNFGEHNGARLRPYIRLDVSANYYFRRHPDGRENGLNFSLYNALGRRNDIFYRILLEEDHRFRYRSIYYKIMFLPSVGYFHRF